ncbi:MAG TPA: hypothetical protein VFW44_15370, partial [Bryobacteraceae bacterium]|nr:hypothetical protein [Bryobacteraceae bacterium]
MEGSNNNKAVTANDWKTWARKPWVQGFAGAVILVSVVLAVLSIPYRTLARRVDRQLAGAGGGGVEFYSAPEIVAPGDPMVPADLAALRQADQLADIRLSNGRI